MQNITPTIKNILIATISFFIVLQIIGENRYLFALYELNSKQFRPFQFVTSMFTHYSLNHIFFNMLTLFFFGPIVERTIGAKRTIIAYLMGGILSCIIFGIVYTYMLNSQYALLGASGAVYTIVVLAAMYYPQAKVGILFLPFQLPLNVLVLIYIGIDITMMGLNTSSGIAHLAHLGGAAIGAILYYAWKGKVTPRGWS